MDRKLNVIIIQLVTLMIPLSKEESVKGNNMRSLPFAKDMLEDARTGYRLIHI